MCKFMRVSVYIVSWLLGVLSSNVGNAVYLCICIFIVIVNEIKYFLFLVGVLYDYVILREICVSFCETV